MKTRNPLYEPLPREQRGFVCSKTLAVLENPAGLELRHSQQLKGQFMVLGMEQCEHVSWWFTAHIAPSVKSQ